ncbi:hypothetical protein [Fumia xinanensis]|nr:hypothetical protein [Fumia xinanensis]
MKETHLKGFPSAGSSTQMRDTPTEYLWAFFFCKLEMKNSSTP